MKALLGPKTAIYLGGLLGPPIPERWCDSPYLKGLKAASPCLYFCAPNNKIQFVFLQFDTFWMKFIVTLTFKCLKYAIGCQRFFATYI